MDVRPRPSTLAVREGIRVTPAEVVMASAVATLASTSRAMGLLVETPTLATIGGVGLLVALAIALQGVRRAASYPSALDTRRRRTRVRTAATRTSPTTPRPKVVGSVAQAPFADVGEVPTPASSVGEDELDGRSQDEGMVTALATIVRGASVALPIRATVVALLATRLGRIAIPSPGAEAIGTPTGVATKPSAMVLVVH